VSTDMRQIMLEQLSWRYAVKKFDPGKKISDKDWKVLEESLRLSPSSYNLQPWKFFVVQDQSVKEKLRVASWNQSQVTDCSHLVVLIHKTKMDLEHIEKYLKSVGTIRGLDQVTLEKMKASMVNDLIKGVRASVIDHWAERQTYIAMGMITAVAAAMKIDTCPMEGLNPHEYDKILGVEGSGWKTVAAIGCGYRHPEDKFQLFKKVRFDRDDVFKYF
jgi:nitroreductase